MYTATILINITGFVPISAGNIAATLGRPTDTSPGAPTGVFSVVKGPSDTQNLVVTTPLKYTGSVQITYQLPQTEYVLAGIAIDPSESGGHTGRKEFRTVTINRDPSGSQMTVTDACISEDYGVDFNYVILVQQASDLAIGQIDPGDENEPGE